MSAERIYLDWNATAPLRPEARAAMLSALDWTGNASSVHTEGRRARALIEAAREEVAALVGSRPGEIIFTSGATEANVTALSQGWDSIVSGATEHDSVSVSAARLGGRSQMLPVGSDGMARLDCLLSLARAEEPHARRLIALQLANNETGVLQPLAEAVEIARAHGWSVHTDAVQALGKVAIDFSSLGVGSMAISSHKIGGPQGVGALVVGEASLSVAPSYIPLLRGGGQEGRRRAGTENVAAIAGFGAAARAAKAELSHARLAMAELRDELETGLRAATPDVVVLSATAPRLPNTSCFARPGRNAEVWIAALDLAGYAVSAGAACSSGRIEESAVTLAMGLPADLRRSAIRVSLGRTTTRRDIAAFIETWTRLAIPQARAA